MIVRCISYTGDRATVVLEPGLIGRLFGRRAVSVDIERHRYGDGSHGGWRTVATGRDIDRLPSGRAIADALDFREIGSPARRSITAGAGAEAVAP